MSENKNSYRKVNENDAVTNSIFAVLLINGWNWETAQVYIDECIDNYFKELAINWENENNILIRISQIETQLLLKCATQIFDIADTKLNGKSENYVVHENSIPKRNSVIELEE